MIRDKIINLNRKIAPSVMAGLFFLTLSGCATAGRFITPEHTAEIIARDNGLAKEYITSGCFVLLTYSRFDAPADILRVYIEGDGKAWKTRRRLSDDPTPSNPVALGLAASDRSSRVAYIARPGQYQRPDARPCDPTYWSERRFAPEVIDAVNGAIDKLKLDSRSKNIELVGYSGGGAIAVLIAARRQDVISLRTIAGNLDHVAFSNYHGVSPLKGSLNPIDVASTLRLLPQRHFIGSDDKTIPPYIIESFIEKTGDASHSRVTKVKGAGHSCGWREKWQKLLLLPPS